jgi:hypothetical protein
MTVATDEVKIEKQVLLHGCLMKCNEKCDGGTGLVYNRTGVKGD